MDAFALTDPSDQAEASARMGVATIIIEKDFWVCWGLKRLFELDAPGNGFLFKGGTSLSKAYGLIERFSEDIDVLLDCGGLGAGGNDDLVRTLGFRSSPAPQRLSASPAPSAPSSTPSRRARSGRW